MKFLLRWCSCSNDTTPQFSQEMRLNVQEGQSSRQYVRGVGGEGSDSVKVEVLELPWLEMAGHRFDKVCAKH